MRKNSKGLVSIFEAMSLLLAKDQTTAITLSPEEERGTP